ncbi:ACR3 family arsenite efflux pump ArsB [Methylohalomonas lacus]|uniref:ACR3 family arsenite efflux pump ArsB n=1 Tax=Methylohalomonas lacus TaxID=398773 RepID=A0AAE3HLE4_9GAMM|nr:arsenic resistance protein [Methylohalomonas lacus]MCS3903378.1 ACR3 family arsenite efflux pump ArsB [Methylohalomonas lacus]
MRAALERQQAWIYLAAILAGMVAGTVAPATLQSGAFLLWPALGLLLYVTFTQVPLTRLTMTFRDGRFIAALLVGNFLCIPLIVGLLRLLLPAEPAIQLGVLLVLLVPCTDWFISFTYLGRGDAPRAIAAAPLLLVAQLLLLPVYLWLFIGTPAIELALGGHLLTAFSGLILLPLMLAWLTEYIVERSHHGKRLVEDLGILPVPLLAVVVFLIAGSQIGIVLELSNLLAQLLLVFALYLIAAAGLGKLLARWFRLSVRAARTLAFSFGTRNSFVVLPLALAAPDTFRAAVVVIVFQSLVELFGMVAFVQWIPRWLMPDR